MRFRGGYFGRMFFGWAAAVGALIAGSSTPAAEEQDYEVALASALEEAACEPCDGGCCGGVPCRLLDPLGQDPVWTGRVEALLLWRSAPQSTPLYQFVDPQTLDVGGVALGAADFQSGMAAGPRFTLFRHTGDMGAIEFNYLRVQSFSSRQSLPTIPDGYIDTQPHGLYCCNSQTPRDSASGLLSSSFQSAEVNRRFPTDGRLGWLMGFRWVEWNDGLGLQSLTTPAQLDPYTRNYLTRTSNDLYGLQIGADSILYGVGRPFRIEGIGKAGIFYNDASQSSRFSTTDPNITPDTLAVRTSTGRAAFVGEVGVTGVYDITDRISLRAGYAIFWLGGLAMAPNQFAHQMLCPDNPIMGATDTGGSVVVQGLTLGLEGLW